MHQRPIPLALALLAIFSAAALAQHRPRGGSPGGAGGGPDAVLATAGEWGGARGVYTCEQWRQYLQRMYNVADKRHRGFFDAQDFEAVRRISLVFRSASFDYFDMAGKGKVTKAEFLAFPSPFFARYDKRKTCHVTQEELARAQSPSAGAQSPSAGAQSPSAGGAPGFPGRSRGGGFGGGYGGGFGGGGFGGGGFGR